MLLLQEDGNCLEWAQDIAEETGKVSSSFPPFVFLSHSVSHPFSLQTANPRHPAFLQHLLLIKRNPPVRLLNALRLQAGCKQVHKYEEGSARSAQVDQSAFLDSVWSREDL
jgi:hypothetical protein